MLFSSIINYTKKSLRPHGLGDFSVRGVFLQPLFIERKRDMRKKYFDYIIVPICVIVCFIMCLKDQNNKVALIIGGGCIGMQIVLLIDGIEKCIKEQKNKDK